MGYMWIKSLQTNSAFTITTYLHYDMHTFTIHDRFWTHMSMQFIKIPNSWLFHINIIYISKYNVENLDIKLHFISFFFFYYKEFTQQYEYENQCKSLYFSLLLRTSIEKI
jgi:hypothetical protein